MPDPNPYPYPNPNPNLGWSPWTRRVLDMPQLAVIENYEEDCDLPVDIFSVANIMTKRLDLFLNGGENKNRVGARVRVWTQDRDRP
jgi:hypothetical protein